MRKSFIMIGTIITTLGIAFSPVSSKASGNTKVMPKTCNIIQPTYAARDSTPVTLQTCDSAHDNCTNLNDCMNSISCGNLNQFLQDYLAKNYPNLAWYFSSTCPNQEACVNPTENSGVPGETVTTPGDTTCIPNETTSAPEEATTIPEETASAPEEATSIPNETMSAPEEATGNHESSAEKPTDNELPTNTPWNPAAETQATYEEQVVALVNAERAKEGLPALKVDETLQAAALARAKETVQLFSHTRPNGTSCFTILKEYGISYRYAGENIAYGQRSPEEVVNAWMNSEGHRANIMNQNFTTIGIGYYQTSNGTKYWSQLFLS